MMNRYRLLPVIVAVLLLLSACTEPDQAVPVSETQKYYLLESLSLVELAGRALQDRDLSEAKIKQALETMDQGLKMAFQVESEFLNSLDVRLGRNYQRYFVSGVENYRLGIEAADQLQQKKGLEQLAQWAAFWSAEQSTITERLKTL
jgi:hypothetical protein